MSLLLTKKYLNKNKLPTPCLVMDLSLIENAFKKLQSSFPISKIYYAVKANSAPEILNCLKNSGSYFDVSSKKEIEICLKQSINPSLLSYGNTIKKQKDILWAYKKGIRVFAFDSIEEINKICRSAKNSKVFCRLQVPNQGANWPLSKKFGCSVNMAKELMLYAKNNGVIPAGLSFHVGSQQTNIKRWTEALKICYEVFQYLKKNKIELEFINIGGGIPVNYKDFSFDLRIFAKKINKEIKNIFLDDIPKIMLEPGRALVAEAGIIETEVILVSKKKKNDTLRWVYIDIGRFGGLAESEGEAIKYKISTSKEYSCKQGPVIIAGPTCDGADIIYENNYELPLDIKSGDRLRIYGTGAYTSVYSSDFNSVARIKEYFLKAT